MSAGDLPNEGSKVKIEKDVWPMAVRSGLTQSQEASIAAAWSAAGTTALDTLEASASANPELQQRAKELVVEGLDMKQRMLKGQSQLALEDGKEDDRGSLKSSTALEAAAALMQQHPLLTPAGDREPEPREFRQAAYAACTHQLQKEAAAETVRSQSDQYRLKRRRSQEALKALNEAKQAYDAALMEEETLCQEEQERLLAEQEEARARRQQRLEQEQKEREEARREQQRLEKEREELEEARLREQQRLEEEQKEREQARLREQQRLEREMKEREEARLREQQRLEREMKEREEARLREQQRLEKEMKELEEARRRDQQRLQDDKETRLRAKLERMKSSQSRDFDEPMPPASPSPFEDPLVKASANPLADARLSEKEQRQIHHAASESMARASSDIISQCLARGCSQEKIQEKLMIYYDEVVNELVKEAVVARSEQDFVQPPTSKLDRAHAVYVFVCMCVCMYVCMCVCPSIYIYMHIYIDQCIQYMQHVFVVCALSARLMHPCFCAYIHDSLSLSLSFALSGPRLLQACSCTGGVAKRQPQAPWQLPYSALNYNNSTRARLNPNPCLGPVETHV